MSKQEYIPMVGEELPGQYEKYIPPSAIQASNPDDAQVLHLAQTLYGEFAGVKDSALQGEYMTMAASAAHNLHGKREHKKDDWDTYLYKRFDAVKYQNQPYKEALQGNFDTPAKDRAWKKAMQVAYGVTAGTISKASAEFYWTPKEYKKIAGGPALPNPDQLEKTGSLGQYDLYRYKAVKKAKRLAKSE
jgi:hypothetical protein